MNGEQLLALCRDALAEAGEGEAEVYARVAERGCARFAVGALGQHMELSEPHAVVRVAHGRRLAEAATSRLDREALVHAIRDAARAAKLVPEVEGFPGFAGRDETRLDGTSPAPPERGQNLGPPPRFADATARATPEERVARLAPVLEAIRGAGLVSAGMLETTRAAHAVATTHGCERSHDASVASFRVWALETAGAGGAAGYGGQVHRDVGALRLAEETERAIRICKMSREPTSLDAGSYDVVMEPEAVTELLEWLAMIAFAAPEVEQGTSPLAGRLGERITGESVNLVEDPVDASDLGFGAPFDREGTPRRRVPLVERGVGRAVLYDRTYAARAGTASTGSALLPGLGSPGGVGATSVSLDAGTAASVDELIAGVDRGLYVCRLHYVNGLLEPRRAVMTGLTRDGCFLVERGKIARPVGNLRFTDSFLEGLARCDAMTRTRKAVPTWWSDAGAYVSPAIRMRAFRFNGKSQERYVSAPGSDHATDEHRRV
jgi:predicted Zn-dependent protease